jgi:3-oxoacyl-[acyl-carrier protein] reductase
VPGSESFPVAQLVRFRDIEIDQVFEVERSFSREDTLAFAALSGDYSPLHVDAAYAAGTEFGGCVVHGMLLASLFSQLVGMRVPGVHALYLGQDLTFRRPVLVGEIVRAKARVTSKSDATRTIVLATEIHGADGKIAVAGTARVKVRDAQIDPSAGQDSAYAGSKMHATAGSVAIVTGASGAIGAEIARTLARRGIMVAVNYLSSSDRAAAVVADIRAAGGAAQMFQADVREVTAVEQMLRDITRELGDPTILVNAAIGELGSRPFSELTWTDFEAQLGYQLKAVVQLCHGVYPAMKRSGAAAVVNLLSQVTAGVPPIHMADYVSAKHALEGLSKALAAEWASDGIRVNMVSPGLTRTDLTQFYQERVFKMEAARTPLKRIATPQDIAAAVAFLAGNESSYLTGTNLFVTGGQVMF